MNDIVSKIYESWFSIDYPKQWSVIRVKELISLIRKEKNNKENTPVISLTINGVKLKENLNEGMNPETYIGHQLVYPGDLVICLRDLDGPLLVGISEHYGCTSNLYYVLQMENQNLEFYHYVFKTMDFLRVIDDFSYGMRHSYNISQFCQLRLPSPELSLQDQIVRKLKDIEQKVNRLIENQQQQIEKLKEYKQSLISEVVTKGVAPNVDLKDCDIEWINKIPFHWNVSRMKDVAMLKTGTTPRGNYGINTEGDGFMWFTPGDFTNIILEKSEKFITEKAIHKYGIQLYDPKSILLIGIGATAGKIGFADKKCYSNQQITQIFPTNILPKYLLFFLESQTKVLRDLAMYTTLPIINNRYLGTIPVLIPHIEEQNEIVEFLNTKVEKVDKLVEAKNTKINKLEEYKKSLIYEYVTGKKEIGS